MKLLLYSEYFYPIPGGTQTVVLELARGIPAWSAKQPGSGTLEVTLVTQTQGAAEDDARYPFKIIRRPGVRRLARLLRASDVIHIAGPALLPMALSFLFRKPFFVEHHGCQVACPNGLLFYEPTQTPCPGHYMARRFHKCIECNRKTLGTGRSVRLLALTPVRRWLSNRATSNIVPTNWLGTVVKLNRMKTIYHGISPAPAVTSKNATDSTFAFQGRLVTTKGAGLLFEAANHLHKDGFKFRLKIMGDGPELNSLKSQAASLDGIVEFLGHVPDERLGEIFSDVTAVVMPSLGGEVFGLVAAENMLRGKVLIVSDIGSLGELVGDTGLIFPAGDAIALASCMRKVLEDPSLAASLGPAARNRAVQAFNLDSMIRDHVSLYRGTSAREDKAEVSKA
jgi:glycogen synthase